MKKLLIADDEQEIIQFLQEFFREKSAFQILTAVSEDEALEHVRNEKPDLMLLDIKFGKTLSGLDILAETRNISPETKVIMMTAVEDRHFVDRAIKLGAINYITKPLSLEYLESEVKNILGEASQK